MKTIILFLIATFAYGQGSDTIFVQARASNAALQGIRNIGQSQHLITVVLRHLDPVKFPCAGFGTVTTNLEASWDGAFYFRISPPEVTMDLSTGAPFFGNALAFGAYPFLRVVQPNNYANCPMDVFYSGTVPVGPATRLPVSLGAQVLASGVWAALPILPIVSFGPLTPIPAGSRIVPYSVHVRNAAAVPNNVMITYINNATCTLGGGGATVGYLLLATALQPYQSLQLPASNLPLHQGVASSALCLTLSNASLVEYSIVYRVE